jgi:hypothetical protein
MYLPQASERELHMNWSANVWIPSTLLGCSLQKCWLELRRGKIYLDS